MNSNNLSEILNCLKNFGLNDKKYVRNIFQNYNFFYICSESFDINNQIIQENLQNSKIIMINQYKEKDLNDIFFIINFKKTLIIINQSFLEILKPCFSKYAFLLIYFLSNSKDIFNKKISIPNQQFDCKQTHS